MPSYRLLFAKPLLRLFSLVSITYVPVHVRRDGLVRYREFVTAVAQTLFPITNASMVPLPNATVRPYIFDTAYGIFDAVEIDHNALYPHILISFARQRKIFGDELFYTWIRKYEDIMRLRERTRKDEYIIVTPRVNSAFKIADVVSERLGHLTRNRRLEIYELENENPIRGYENAIEIAKSLGVSCTIFRFRDFLKGLLLTRIGVLKYYEYNIFVNVLTMARNIAREVYEYARENEFDVIRVYIDSYTIEGDKHDAKSLLRCRVFDNYPAKIEATGTLYHYLPPTYVFVNNNEIIKHGVWLVYALEPSRIRYRDNVIEYLDYVEVPKMLAYRFAKINVANVKTITIFKQAMLQRRRGIIIERSGTRIRMRPSETKKFRKEVAWTIEPVKILRYATF